MGAASSRNHRQGNASQIRRGVLHTPDPRWLATNVGGWARWSGRMQYAPTPSCTLPLFDQVDGHGGGDGGVLEEPEGGLVATGRGVEKTCRDGREGARAGDEEGEDPADAAVVPRAVE